MKSKLRALPYVIFLGVAFAACSSSGVQSDREKSFSTLAAGRGIQIGTAISTAGLEEQPQYRQLAAQNFDLYVPEAQMNFHNTHPERGRFDFSKVDAVLETARRDGKRVRGHNLVWDVQLPEWVAKLSHEDRKALLKEHIQTVIRHCDSKFPGLVDSWIVVNEAIAEDGSFRNSPFSDIGGTPKESIALAFQWAHEASPKAKLFYNEKHAEGLNARSDAIYAMAKDFVKRGVPMHAIGLQMHFSTERHPPLGEVQANMQRLAELGLTTGITELDVRIPVGSDKENREQQARYYRDYVSVCLRTSGCKSIVFWGFTDAYSWVPRYFQDKWGAALLWDEFFRPKQTHQAVIESLRAW